ncbi:VanZ family protein [Paenibacillus sp. JDR-2]|uniref:VanZ family protein n=1 Tax=Paenibacillus sp. (strain JDR-2) TaxID=324057 RepID=UPI000166BA74|nr:VanZ family protein [Paenibacillus sp. JDR-2]ACT01863.1 VanZ family protein [Paenibacillus sp. JDR-2]
MNTRQRIETVFLYGVCICYILVLMKILFLSRVSITEIFNSQRTITRSINLVPFHSIAEFVAGSTANSKKFAFANVIGNILIFIPLGVYLPLFKNNYITNVLSVVTLSLFVEIIQGLLGIGTADIDDIILNSIGGWIGLFIYKLIHFILRHKNRVITAITVISTIVGLPITYYLLFMIKMRF